MFGSALKRLLGVDKPDITYNPNPNTNIPYSTRSPQDARLGNRYVANPTGSEFLGVDPARFGFPADNTVKIQPQLRIGNQASQQQSIGPVRRPYPGMQPFLPSQEDDYTPAAALENTGYFNPQTTLYGYAQQDARFFPQQDPNYALRRLLRF